MRLNELHPAIVHYPLAFLPVSLGADLVGRLTGSQFLKDFGRGSIVVAAAGAALAGLSGLIAQEEVETDEESHDVLTTHRNLNLGLLGVTAGMAAWRARGEPGVGYFAIGLTGLAGMGYSSYLGSQLVYKHGVGVREAGKLREEAATPLQRARIGEAFRNAFRQLGRGARHAYDDLKGGEVLPVVETSEGESAEGPSS